MPASPDVVWVIELEFFPFHDAHDGDFLRVTMKVWVMTTTCSSLFGSPLNV